MMPHIVNFFPVYGIVMRKELILWTILNNLVRESIAFFGIRTDFVSCRWEKLRLKRNKFNFLSLFTNVAY
jgi:hypothetical protein